MLERESEKKKEPKKQKKKTEKDYKDREDYKNTEKGKISFTMRHQVRSDGDSPQRSESTRRPRGFCTNSDSTPVLEPRRKININKYYK